MSETFIEGKEFKGNNFTKSPLAKGDYEECTFVDCNFSDTDLSEINFGECIFTQCDLSNVILHNTALRDVKFNQCKLLGLRFEDCNNFLFSVNFEGCQLNLSSFYKRSLKKTFIRECSLQEVDFTESDLTEAMFDNCDLLRALFEKTILEKADFRTAYNFTIDPEINRMAKAKFSLAGLPGLLGRYGIEVE